MKRIPIMLAALALSAAAWAHSKHTHKHAHPSPVSATAAKQGHSHLHHAPHGGSLQVFGDELAHLELVLDPEHGRLSAYALDGEAEKPVRLAQPTLRLRVQPLDPPGTPFTLTLKAVAHELTGEKVGDSSQFEAQAKGLKGLRRFTAVLTAIRIRGLDFKAVQLRHPEGNE
jgi:hypothetical protein